MMHAVMRAADEFKVREFVQASMRHRHDVMNLQPPPIRTTRAIGQLMRALTLIASFNPMFQRGRDMSAPTPAPLQRIVG